MLCQQIPNTVLANERPASDGYQGHKLIQQSSVILLQCKLQMKTIRTGISDLFIYTSNLMETLWLGFDYTNF